MGLDQYLEARKYVGKVDWREVPLELPEGATIADYYNNTYKELAKLFPKPFSNHSDNGSSVAINVAYWRKANQIHGWFVKNVMNGDDKNDGSDYYVTLEQLKELLDTVTEVLQRKDKAISHEKLPVTGGFFFGNYDEEEGYDQYYYEQLEYTQAMLKDIMSVMENEEQFAYDFHYHSSW